MGLLETIRAGQFAINVEFTPHNATEVRHVASIARGLAELNKKYAPQGIEFASISLTQNPGGNISYDHLASLAILRQHDFPESIEIAPHITGKDMNADAIRALLLSLYGSGIRHVLALTGDLTSSSKGVFELDSLGLLQMIQRLNIEFLQRTRSADEFAAIPLLEAGAAVSPFKYTEGSLAMQYIKAHKKIAAGAAFLTCQCGWDSSRSEHLIRELGACGVPILGNVLVVTHAIARYLQTLPGCVVSDAFLADLQGQKVTDPFERTGQQIAMFRQLGYAGVDLGKPGEFESIEQIEQIVETTLAISDWREYRDRLTFPMPERQVQETDHPAAFSKWVHQMALEKDGPLYGAAKAVLQPFNDSAEREGALYRLFNCAEGLAKGLLYQCEHCGDCFLPDNAYVCTWGGCEKKVPNPPCGDADPQGRCGNNPHHLCVGERLYARLSQEGALDPYREKIFPSRKPQLRNTPSLLNYYFERDHTAGQFPLRAGQLIQVGERLHASIPLSGAVMQYLLNRGDRAFTEGSRGLKMLEEIIASQARLGCHYLDVNLDALGASDAPALMRQYMRQIHRFGLGTPPSVDSSDVQVLLAGLDEWFRLTHDQEPAPLINSISYVDLEKFEPLLALRSAHRFSVVCLLVGPEGPMKTVDAIFEAAREMFQKARQAGFQPDEIFFDTVTLSISSDGCMDAMGEFKPSHTYNAFHAIRKIRQNPEMHETHAILGVSNWAYGAKQRRIGHVRAFVAKAQEFGLDAVIADADKRIGLLPAAPELVELVGTFASLDGDENSMIAYSQAMRKARESNWI